MNDMRDVWHHPQLKERGRWTEVATPAGAIPALWSPGATDAYVSHMDVVPELGQHTAAILSNLEWEDAESRICLRQA